jgi:hypothetical protein
LGIPIQSGKPAGPYSLGMIEQRLIEAERPAVGRTAVNALAIAGAILILASAAIHLRLWAMGYRHIRMVGPLFLAQGILCVPVALAVVTWRRAWTLAFGSGLMVSTAAGLLLSHWFGLFHYHESLAVPYAGMSLVVELAAGVLLLAAAGLVITRRLKSP